MKKTHFVLLLFTLALPSLAQPVARPNVVVILADDLGYGDVQVNNPDSTIPTPGLDAVANGGMRFTDAHTPSAVCTPTRYGLLTGRYCWRTRLTRSVLMGYSTHLINPDRLTVADLMKQAGYHTACIGKWHLGMDLAKTDGDWDFTKPIANGPNVNGFDYYFGITASLDMAPYVYIENDRVTAPITGEYEMTDFPGFYREGPRAEDFEIRGALDRLTEQAVGHIKERAETGQPFFLYFPLTAPHMPVLPAERFTGRSGIGPYGDFIIQTDDVIARVDAALREAGVFDNTLVIVTSDNGSFMFRRGEEMSTHDQDPTVKGYRASVHRANGPWRGTKTDIYEGGHRVFFAARLPGVIEPGTVSDQTVSLVDVFATLAELTGQPLPDDAAEDSYSMLPLLAGKQAEYERGAVVMHSINGTFAIRQGKWKLIASSGSGGREKPAGEPFDGGYQLYDMEADPAETDNLFEREPEIAAELKTLLMQYREEGRSR